MQQASSMDEIIFSLLITLFIIAVIILVLFFVLRYFLRKIWRYKHAFNRKVLLITLPKEAADKEQQEKNQENIQQNIAVAETFFASIGGLSSKGGLKSYFIGRSDHFSFEIVADRGLISFYITLPDKFQRHIEQQIHAQYPNAMIEEVEDYNCFEASSKIVGSYLMQKKSYFFPIKTYRKMESDPLNSITNVLSKLQEPDSAVIQYVMRSSKPGWHYAGKRISREVGKGKSLSEAIQQVQGNPVVRFIGDFIKAVTKQAQPGEMPEEQKEKRLSQMEEETLKGIEEKNSKAGLDVNVRVIVDSEDINKAQAYLQDVVNAFTEYNIYEYGNAFKASPARTPDKIVHDFIFRNFVDRKKCLFNTEEITSLFHFPLPTTQTPNIRWLKAKKAAPPTNLPKEGVILGESEYRGEKMQVRIKENDRLRHIYIIGQTGVGKSYTMANMAVQDIENGDGCCLLDPHGGLIDEAVLPNIPKERAEDVIYFDPADMERPLGLNMMEYDEKYPEQKTFVINEMISIFDKLYDLKATGGPMFEQYMRNAMLLVMDDPESGSTLMEIPRVLADEQFRKYKLSKTDNVVVKRFWVEEAEKAGGEASLANMVPYITSKLNTFISNDYMRPIISQQKSGFNFRKIMDEKKILLINLSKGRIGDLNAELLGLVLIGKMLMASLSRVDIPEKERVPFYLYIDEFQNYITDSIAVILSEARKYKLCLTMAHQFVGQLVKNNDTSIKDAVFGNVGTIMAYRVGVEDAELFAKQFDPIFNEFDVMNIDKYTYNIKLLIDGAHARPFNVRGRVLPDGNPQMVPMIKQLSRLKHGRDRSIVEAEIKERAEKRYNVPGSTTSEGATVMPSGEHFI